MQTPKKKTSLFVARPDLLETDVFIGLRPTEVNPALRNSKWTYETFITDIISRLPTGGGGGSAILYSSTGANTDGAMTQKATTDFLATKSNINHTHSYNALTDKPTIPGPYTLPTASATVLGGVKVGTGLSITNGVLSATATGTGTSYTDDQARAANDARFDIVEADVNTKEPAIGPKGSAFNKDFGTTATTVAPGNHLHDGRYIRTVNSVGPDANGNVVVATTGGEGGVAGVSSVNGRAGVVTLTKNDVALGDVDNTTDLNKPVSTATQAALSNKISEGDYRLSDARTPTTHTHPASQITGLAAVATTGSYNSLADKPTIPDTAGFATTTQLNDNATADRSRANHTGTQPATTITGLATVATTGSYNSLTEKPTIPAAYDPTALTGRVSTAEGNINTLATGLDMTIAEVAAQDARLDVLEAQKLTFNEQQFAVTPQPDGSKEVSYIGSGGGYAGTSFAEYLGDSKYNFSAANSAAVNTTAINAAITAALASSSRLLFPGGDFQVDPFTIPEALQVAGAGGEDSYLLEYGTRLNYSGTGDLILVTGRGVELHNLGLRNLNPDITAGSGIKIDIQKPHPNVPSLIVGGSFRLRDCTVNGFYINYDVVNAFEWNVDNCHSQNSRLAGFRLQSRNIPDGGDGHLTGCQILAGRYGGGHGILQLNGGGFAMSQTKFNSGRGGSGKFANCYEFIPDYSGAQPGTLADTSILLIGSGNSFENFTGHAVKVDGVSLVTIDGPIEIAPYGSALPPFFFANCVRGVLSGVNFRNEAGDGNGMSYLATFSNCSEWIIGPNQDWDFADEPVNAYQLINCTKMRVIGAGSSSGGGGGPVDEQPDSIGAYRFGDPGTNQNLNFANPSALAFNSGGWTFAAWINLTNPGDNFIAGRAVSASQGAIELGAFYNTEDPLALIQYFAIMRGPGAYMYTIQDQFTAGRARVVFMHDGTGNADALRIYRNNVLLSNDAGNGGTWAGVHQGGNFTIGSLANYFTAAPPQAQSKNATIDCVYLLGRALTPQEVAEDYNGGSRNVVSDLSYAGELLAAYTFENNLLDISGNGNHLSATSPNYVAI